MLHHAPVQYILFPKMLILEGHFQKTPQEITRFKPNIRHFYCPRYKMKSNALHRFGLMETKVKGPDKNCSFSFRLVPNNKELIGFGRCILASTLHLQMAQRMADMRLSNAVLISRDASSEP